ncbi:hypothetical protein NDU88_005307 [Pleurodeles waltl]|uniref:Uncharacterized protein n=1 Tax=Pleurodeles waltl TaxID=8319 RepID=A0AAV7MX41_PLEWA|nr:hypothetical protein NDU88_005307 [Pleurodeles waltl]
MGLEWGLPHLRNSSSGSNSARSSPAAPRGLSLSSSVRRSCVCTRLQGYALILVEAVPLYCVGPLQRSLTRPAAPHRVRPTLPARPSLLAPGEDLFVQDL